MNHSALLLACKSGKIEIVQYLITKQESKLGELLFTLQDSNGNTAFQICCINGHLQLVDYFLTTYPHVADEFVLMQNKAGNSALMLACMNGKLEITKRIVFYFDTNFSKTLLRMKNKSDHTVLDIAIAHKRTTILEFIKGTFCDLYNNALFLSNYPSYFYLISQVFSPELWKEFFMLYLPQRSVLSVPMASVNKHFRKQFVRTIRKVRLRMTRYSSHQVLSQLNSDDFRKLTYVEFTFPFNVKLAFSLKDSTLSKKLKQFVSDFAKQNTNTKESQTTIDLNHCIRFRNLMVKQLDVKATLEIRLNRTKNSELITDEFEALKKLKEMKDITFIEPKFTYVPCINHIESLRIIEAKENSLTSAQSLEACTLLKKLTLSKTKITDIPVCTSLVELDLSYSIGVTDASSIKQMHHLRKLCLRGLSNLKSLPISKTVEELDISQCSSVLDFTILEYYAGLHKLDASWTKLVDLVLFDYSKLQSLGLVNCKRITDFGFLEKTTMLKALDVSWTKIETVPQLVHLETLSMERCLHIENFNCLEHLKSLRWLNLGYNNMEHIPLCISIRHLVLQCCTALEADAFAELANFVNLEYLNLSYTGVEYIPPLSNLKTLMLSSCIEFSRAGYLENCPNLEYLSVSSTAVQSIPYCPLLKEISIRDMIWLRKLTHLKDMPKLNFVETDQCDYIRKFTSLPSHVRIQERKSNIKESVMGENDHACTWYCSEI